MPAGPASAPLVAADHPGRVSALVVVAPATPEAPIVWPVRLMRARLLGELALGLATRSLVAYGLRRWLFAGAERVTDHSIDDAWFPLTIPGTPRGGASRSARTRAATSASRIVSAF